LRHVSIEEENDMRPKFNLQLLLVLEKQKQVLLKRYEEILRIIFEIETTNKLTNEPARLVPDSHGNSSGGSEPSNPNKRNGNKS
jgi:hypothetical protein